MSCSCSCKCEGDEVVNVRGDVVTSTTSGNNLSKGFVEPQLPSEERSEAGGGTRKSRTEKAKKKKSWYNFWDSETKNADCGCSSQAEQTKPVARGPQLTAAQTISDLAGWFNYPQREQFLFNSEMNESMSGSSNSVDHINPVEVQGSEDIMGAENLIFPQFTQNISGQGRTFANTIHPGMVIPNPDNYPTPVANNPWEPFVDIQTYGDIKNVPFQPYPSAMQWATNPDNYQEYSSTDYAAEDSTKIFEATRRNKLGSLTNAPPGWNQETAIIKKNTGPDSWRWGVKMTYPTVTATIRSRINKNQFEMYDMKIDGYGPVGYKNAAAAKKALAKKNKQKCCH